MKNVDIDAHDVCERDGHAGEPCYRCGEGMDFPFKPSDCDHKCDAISFVDVNHFADGRGMADIRIRCGDCGNPFRFKGFRCGVSLEEPTVSVGATELRVPMQAATADNHPLGTSPKRRD